LGQKIREPKPDQLLIKPETALVESGLAKDLEHARSLISCGLVFMGDHLVDNRTKITEEELVSQPLRVKYKKPYVSRGAVKLESVFKNTDIGVTGFTCLDVGSSTGGFTQLLLEKGASKVYAVDVGKGILDQKLRTDKRVIVMEGVNARLMDEDKTAKENLKPGMIDLCVMDLSFISLKLVVPKVFCYIKKGGYLVPLIKPQFEAPRDKIEAGGVVRDQSVVDGILRDMSSFLQEMGMDIIKMIPSDIKGPSGNLEYFCVTRKKL
jgi:23S rRNA (cytidine1920-2'-O)/16S rRNA (cytidine1409-2'-O)-methyltransferase